MKARTLLGFAGSFGFALLVSAGALTLSATIARATPTFNLSALSSSAVTIEVDDSVTDLTGVTVNVSYDPSELEFDSASPGALISDGFVFGSGSAGTATISGCCWSSGTGTGPLFSVVFDILPGALPGLTSVSFETDASAIGFDGEYQIDASVDVTITGSTTSVPAPPTGSLLLFGALATIAARSRRFRRDRAMSSS